MLTFFKKSAQFIKDVANDPRVPDRDKKVILALALLIASPIDIIPDWIPFFGQLDDLVLLAIILDYFFRVLDSQILLSHYPWGMKSFIRLRWCARSLSFLVPRFFSNRVWAYVGSPYRK